MQPTPLRREMRSRQGYHPLFFTAWGFALWLATALIVRLAGQWFLVPSTVTWLAAAYYGSIPLIAAVTLPVYYLRRLDANNRVRAALLVALPGMMLHMVTALLFQQFFPNLPPEAVGPFASWLFWAYGLILLTGLIRAGRTRQG